MRDLQRNSPPSAPVAEPRAAPVDLAHRGVSTVLNLPFPPPHFWRIVTETAEAGQPWIEANKRLLGAFFDDRTIRDWPANWMQPIDETLPPLTRDEALAVLDRFLQCNSGGLHEGATVYTLQWLSLVTVYFPGKEHFRALGDLVRADYLREAPDAVCYHNSRIRFPLIVTSSAVEAIKKLRSRSRAEASPVSRKWLRAEDWWADRATQYPLLERIITFFGGAGLGTMLTVLLT